MKSMTKSFIKNVLPASWMQYRSRSDRTVCLTFDDGPHPNTEKILEVLRKNNVKASFFLNGSAVRNYPELAKKIRNESHFIGNHFYDHVSVKTLDETEMKRQVESNEAFIQEVTGVSIRAVRPPYGDWNLRFLRYAVGTGRRIIFWTLDTEDGDPENSSKASILEHCEPLRGGDIVLMHEDNPHTVEALPEIIAAGRMKGLEFETVEGGV